MIYILDGCIFTSERLDITWQAAALYAIQSLTGPQMQVHKVKTASDE